MKKLEISQMENLQGGMTFDQCMDKMLSKWQIQLAIAAGTVLGGGWGLFGGFAAIATRCNQLT